MNQILLHRTGAAESRAPSESISVVVPVFNSATTLERLIAELQSVLGGEGCRVEIILVNDGSVDASWQRIVELAWRWPNVRGIDLMRNFGQHNALLCGIRAARHNLIVTIDDDLQHPPTEIPSLLAKLCEGCDVVYGTPGKERHGALRNLASRLTKRVLQGAMGARHVREISAFRVFRTRLRDSFARYRGPQVSIDALLRWSTARVGTVSVAHKKRLHGKSNYTFGKLVAHALNLATGLSTLPLRLASFLGFAFTMVGFLALTFVVARFVLSGERVPGFHFLASMTAVLAGVQFLILGIMGEYLARVYSLAIDQPSYAVRQELGKHYEAPEFAGGTALTHMDLGERYFQDSV